jgi:hypothetical protein
VAPPKITKSKALAQDPEVERWRANLARGSKLTAQVYLRRLSRACELLDSTPRKLIEKASEDMKGFQDSLQDMVTQLESQGKSPGYILGIVKVVKSWLRQNDIEVTRRIKVSRPSATPTLEDEQIPSKEELSRIFRSSSLRVRAAEVLMAFGDLRPQVLGNHDGSDGLTLGDLPELKIGKEEVEFTRIPSMVVVRPDLSKARHRYFTFLSGEGCTYLKEYLDYRIRQGEALGPSSSVIGHERSSATRRFQLTKKISHLIRTAMRRAGVYNRPYVLRCYAETQLIIAESRGKISHPYVQFIAGHKGDIESRYSTNKGKLSPEMIEDMRQAYERCEPFLSTVEPPLAQDLIVKEAKMEALKSIAKNLLGIDLLEVKIAKERELEKELDLDEEIELFENEIRRMREGNGSQSLVDEEELETYLGDGWEFISVLPSRKILIRKEG